MDKLPRLPLPTDKSMSYFRSNLFNIFYNILDVNNVTADKARPVVIECFEVRKV